MSRGRSPIKAYPLSELRGKKAGKPKPKTLALKAAREFRNRPEAKFMVKLIKTYPGITRQNLFKVNSRFPHPLNLQIIDAIIGISLSARLRTPGGEIIRGTNLTPEKTRAIISMLNEKTSHEFTRAVKLFVERNPEYLAKRPLLKKQLLRKQLARKHLVRV